jgi:hypothetical protein
MRKKLELFAVMGFAMA